MDLATNTENPDQLDQLYSEINAPAAPRQDSGPPDAQEQKVAPQPVAEPPKPVIEEREFTWNGQKVKAPIDMIVNKYAPMGYDYAQKMAAFKADQEKHKAEIAQTKKGFEKYIKVDEYVQKDPSWWQFVEEQWAARQNSLDPNAIRLQALLEEKIKPIEEKISVQEQERLNAHMAREDADFATEVKSIREKYSDIDFDTRDAEGKSLEYRVLEHGAQNGFKTFKTAFRDFYHDQLEKRAEARGREALTKDSQKKAKLGLSATQTPKRSDEINVRGKSWSQLMEEIVQKEGLT